MKKHLFKTILTVAMTLVLLISLLPLEVKGASLTSPKNEMRAAWIATVQNVDM